ncbi:MAG: hypothetical protein WC838_03275, partial [Candidatus Margulisiibacteriota bacterium]
MFKQLKPFVASLMLLTLVLTSLVKAEEYPQLDIMGYKEYNLTQSSLGGNAELAKQQSLYSRFPTNLRNQAFKWEERLSLYIAGKLSEDLSVSYSLEQEPDFPDRYDINVKYRENELNFGHFNAEFTGSEFVAFNKAMDGFMADSKGKDYKLKVVTAKERSTAKLVTLVGNGSKDYSLGQRYILPGSVKVRVNQVGYPDSEYTVNNYDGVISFSRIMNATDLIEITYEFTNPIEDLIPTLGKMSFTGFQVDYSAATPPDPVPISETTSENFLITKVNLRPAVPSLDYRFVIRHDFKIDLADTVPGGFVTINAITPFVVRRVWIQNGPSTANIYNLRLLYTPTREEIEMRKPLQLTGFLPVSPSANPGYYNALVFFQVGGQTHRYPVKYKVLSPAEILAKQVQQNAIPSEDIRAFAAELDAGSDDSKQVFYLKQKPIEIGSEQVVLNGFILQKDFDYYLNYLEGRLKIISYALIPSDDIKITYRYLQNQEVTENVRGNGTVGPFFLKNKPLIRKSETVYLDQQKLFRGLDYDLDYLTGRMQFNTKIYPVSNLLVNYKYQIMTMPTRDLQVRPELYTVGASYLEERSKTSKETTEEVILAGTSTLNFTYDNLLNVQSPF